MQGSAEEEEDWEDVSEDEDDSGDEEDVDEDGMNRLMEALGEDGLDDFAQEQLRALEGDEEGDEDEADDDDEDAVSGEEAEEDVEGQDGSDEDEEAEEAGPSDEMPVPVDELSEEEMLDEDAIPRQKVEIDNKVRSPPRSHQLVR